jgi:ABC-type dipeptide/oligopeptide/nickel transport system permease subunit
MKAFAAALRQSRLLTAGVAIVAAFVAVGLLAPWLAPYEPKAVAGPRYERPSWDHLLGTNDGGHDIVSRLVWGSRTTLIVAVSATALILLIGIALGLTAGLRGGLVDTVVMRAVDVFLALPIIPLLIFIAALAGPSLTLSILMIALFTWPQTARIVRSQTLSLRRRGFVDSARGFGGGPLYVVRRHLIPALGPVIAANLVFVAGLAVTTEAALSFLGLGDPSAVSWGAELNRALSDRQITVGSLWLWWMVPFGLALTLAVMGFTLIGVALEPRFNPRWSRSRG